MTTSPLERKVTEWDEDGRRHVLMNIGLRVVPYVRQTAASRWGRNSVRVREYHRSQGEIRDVVYLLMQTKGLRPFEKTKLGFQASFWLRPKKTFGGKRQGVVDSPAKIDLGNLEKAIEDALQGVLFANDVWIWRRGEGEKCEGEEDRFVVHVWELEKPPEKSTRRSKRKAIT